MRAREQERERARARVCARARERASYGEGERRNGSLFSFGAPELLIYADVFANGVLVDRRAFLGTRGLRAPRLGTLRYRTILRAMARSGCSTACWRNATTGTKRTRPSFLATRPRSTTRSSQTRAMATLRPTSFSTPSKSTSGLSMLMLSRRILPQYHVLLETCTPQKAALVFSQRRRCALRACF